MDAKRPMHELLMENSRLLRLLPRFGIGLGFGDRSLEELCMEKGIDSQFFIEIARAYSDDVSGLDPTGLPLACIVDYLHSTHIHYTEGLLPSIEQKITRLASEPKLKQKEKQLLLDFFEEYKNDFTEHIRKEETELLPYIRRVDEAIQRLDAGEESTWKPEPYSINEFEKEHERLEVSLQHLSELIMKYLPPMEDEQLSFEVLEDLSSLVRDLVEHAEMEDSILVPVVAELEDRLKEGKR